MEIRVLKYFLAVAREENISRAAENLHITQPTLSRQISQLEEELGTKLFERGKRLTLTEAGVMLRRRAEEVTELVDRIESDFAEPAEVGGKISVGEGALYEERPSPLRKAAHHQGRSGGGPVDDGEQAAGPERDRKLAGRGAGPSEYFRHMQYLYQCAGHAGAGGYLLYDDRRRHGLHAGGEFRVQAALSGAGVVLCARVEEISAVLCGSGKVSGGIQKYAFGV